MLKLFHPVSQGVMLQPAPVNDPGQLTGTMRHISQVTTELDRYMRMSLEQKRTHRLDVIQGWRFLLRQQPDNQRGVWRLCEAVYELAELDRVNWNAAFLSEKLELILDLIPFAKTKAVCEGVMNYHDSHRRQEWEMDYLQEPAAAEEERA